MSQAVAVDIAVDIPSLIRRYQLPEYYYPSHLRHPNQPFSSPSSVSSSSSASSPLSPSSSSVSSFDQEYDVNDIVNESSGAISVDGEVDTRIDIIQQHQQLQQQQPIIVVVEKRQALDPSCMSVCVCASAPPLSDDDIEHENSQNQNQQKEQQQQQKEEVCVCVICYETFEQTFEQPDQLIRGQNYSMEELEEIEGKQKITDFCQTCKYNVHHKCIDEYRLSKMTDIIRSGYQRGRIQSPNIAGIFGMKCLMCAKEVEKIHVSNNGDINIVKTQAADASEQQQQQQQQQIEEVMQNRIEEAMQNRMQRRLRRRHRLEFCRKKLCSICIMFLVTILLLVFIFRVI
jgi:hypothetical protein